MKINTAEFVSPMHPDKLCDRISDSILDRYLSKDENARCAIETCGGHGRIFITGEVTSTVDVSDLEIKDIVEVITGIKDVIVHLVNQSPEIAQGVDTGGAGDQGIMIGYACDENEELVPQEYYLARRLNAAVFFQYPYDGKTQVTINGNTVRVVCSFQNAPKAKLELICNDFFETEGYEIEALHCNPAGDWNQGGFDADAGVTGRKLAVDNYGPRIPIGGGAFCFDGDTLVKVSDGFKKIKDIVVGDLVYTVNETSNMLELKPVVTLFKKSAEQSYDLLAITLETGEIINITENHEVKTDRGWLRARDLEPNDNILHFSDF